ncbi:hypothetical protein FOZ60_010712 [Perkinsus olseni]|uniref:Uncharacterized protein n=1 Tax=Perkinsus olseni TaxID=32597 RepID=A0A7J6PC23_PEROL|nr:hypothetical protein FOZ60_010712 [Perkinsus olseni]
MGFRDIALISGLGVWSVVVLLRGQLADAALCIDPSFDELFRGLRSAVVVSASDLVPAVATAAKHNLSTTDSTMRSSDVCSSDTDGPYCGPFRSAARSRQILELISRGDSSSFTDRSSIFAGSPGFDSFAEALRAASAKAISRSLPPDDTIKIVSAELEGYVPGRRIGTESDEAEDSALQQEDASPEEDFKLSGEEALRQPLSAAVKSEKSVARVLLSGHNDISSSLERMAGRAEDRTVGPDVKFASDDVRATFIGPWFGGAGGLGVRLDGVGRIHFTRPVVIRSLKGVGDKQVFVFGKLGVSESWRRIIRADPSRFECDTGDVVWVKCRRDGRRRVAKVIFSTDHTLTVNWADGDTSYRTMTREDSECQKVTTVWNTRAVDELVFITSSQAPWLLIELTVAVSTTGDDEPRLLIRITRSGVILLDRIAPGADVVGIDDVVKSAARASLSGGTVETIDDIVLVGKPEEIIRPPSRPSLRSQKGVARPYSLRATVSDRSFMELLKFAKAVDSGKYVVSTDEYSYLKSGFETILARMTLRVSRDFKRHIHFEDFFIHEWDRPTVSNGARKSEYNLDILTGRYYDWFTTSSQTHHPNFKDEFRIVGEYYCEPSGRGTPFELFDIELDTNVNTVLGTFAFELRESWHSYEVGGIWNGVSQTLDLEPINDPSLLIPEGLVAVPLSLTFYEDNGDYLQGSIGALGCDAIYGKLVPPASSTSSVSDAEAEYSREVRGPLVDIAEEIDGLRTNWQNSLFGEKARGSSMLPDTSDTVVSISL